MYHVSAQGFDECMINVHYYNYYMSCTHKAKWNGILAKQQQFQKTEEILMPC